MYVCVCVGVGTGEWGLHSEEDGWGQHPVKPSQCHRREAVYAQCTSGEPYTEVGVACCGARKRMEREAWHPDLTMLMSGPPFSRCSLT
jgi:hypothetical protein